MAHSDVQDTLDIEIAATDITHRPRLLSDNGPAFLSGDLADYPQTSGIRHTSGQPYKPMTQGKIER